MTWVVEWLMVTAAVRGRPSQDRDSSRREGRVTPAAGNEMTVVWTRGNGCSELAALLSEDVPDRITGDLVEQHQPPGRLVSRRFPARSIW